MLFTAMRLCCLLYSLFFPGTPLCCCLKFYSKQYLWCVWMQFLVVIFSVTCILSRNVWILIKVCCKIEKGVYYLSELCFEIKHLKTEPTQFNFNLPSCMSSRGQVLSNSMCMCVVGWQLESEDVFGLSLTDACTQGPFWAGDLRRLCVCLLMCKHEWQCLCVGVCVRVYYPLCVVWTYADCGCCWHDSAVAGKELGGQHWVITTSPGTDCSLLTIWMRSRADPPNAHIKNLQVTFFGFCSSFPE